MTKRSAKALAAIVITGALALGVAACGGDGSDDTAASTGGADAAAVTEFCNELDRLEQPIQALTEIDPATTTEDEISTLNSRLGGNTDNLGLAAQGAEISIDALGGELATLQETIAASSDPPTGDEVAAIQGSAEAVDGEIATLQGEYCVDEGSGAATGTG